MTAVVTNQATARRRPNQSFDGVTCGPTSSLPASPPKPDNPMPSATAATIAPTPRVATENAGDALMISLRASKRRVTEIRLATVIATRTILSLIESLGFASLQVGRVGANRPLLIPAANAIRTTPQPSAAVNGRTGVPIRSKASKTRPVRKTAAIGGTATNKATHQAPRILTKRLGSKAIGLRACTRRANWVSST